MISVDTKFNMCIKNEKKHAIQRLNFQNVW